MFHFTSLYGNGGTKFSKKRLNGDLACLQAAQKGQYGKRSTTALLDSPEENWGILVSTHCLRHRALAKERVDGLV
jgi:hypothetical protein